MGLLWRLFLNPVYRKFCFTILTAIFLVSDFILITRFQSAEVCSTYKYKYDKADCYTVENCSHTDINMFDLSQSLTLFTSFEYQKEKHLININTLKNWKAIQGDLNLVLFTNTSRLRRIGLEAGWNVLPIPKTGSNGSPVIKSMYLAVMEHFNTSFYGMANADILFDTDLVDTLSGVWKYLSDSGFLENPVLIVGQRTNINVKDINLAVNDAWRHILEKSYLITEKFTPDALDYFIVNRKFPWKNIPDFVIGRIGYDNWLLSYARYKGFHVIDATASILAIHQTSALGNFEGFLRKSDDRDYNLHIISKFTLPYLYNLWGVTKCCELKSVYKCGQLFIEQRTSLPKICSSFTYMSRIKLLIGMNESFID